MIFDQAEVLFVIWRHASAAGIVSNLLNSNRRTEATTVRSGEGFWIFYPTSVFTAAVSSATALFASAKYMLVFGSA
jgi:hypothetical protein